MPLGPGFAAQAFDPSDEAGLDFPSTTGAPPRWLWSWDPNLDAVVVPANDPDFLIRRLDLGGDVAFDQFAGATASVLSLTESLIADSHHHYVRYELDNVPAAAFGAYGFFARVLAPESRASEPVLLAFSYGTDVDQYATAADAINRAAVLQPTSTAAGAWTAATS